jgi:hypothetical protein
MRAVAVLCLLLPAASAHAVARKPLPALTLAPIDGASATALPASGSWLLVYVKPDRAGEAVLRTLDQVGAARANVVIVVASTAPEARRLATDFKQLAKAHWYSDASRGVFEALALEGTPAVLGIQSRSVEWRLDGVPADGKKLRSILQSWVVRR